MDDDSSLPVEFNWEDWEDCEPEYNPEEGPWIPYKQARTLFDEVGGAQEPELAQEWPDPIFGAEIYLLDDGRMLVFYGSRCADSTLQLHSALLYESREVVLQMIEQARELAFLQSIPPLDATTAGD